MPSTTVKRGRKRRPFKCPWNDESINGLYQKPGTNVYRITEGALSGREFRENDPHEAVRRFYEMTAPKSNLGKVQGHDHVLDAFKDMAKRTIDAGGSLTTTTTKVGGHWVITDETLTPDQWAWLRKQFHNRPQWVAMQVGIESLAWYKDWKRPAKEDLLIQIGQVYFTQNKLSPNELSRSKCFWAEFVKVAKSVGATTVDQVNHDLATKYETFIEEQNLAPKSKLHRYRKVRGILHFAIKRGKSIEACRRALDALAMLEVRDAHPLDPTPIAVDDFWAIYDQAVKAKDDTFAALLLTALGGALYGGEVAKVRWDEIDLKTGGFVSRRSKTGVSRIAMYPPDVVKAIKVLPRMRDEVFCTKVRSYTIYSVADRFEKYRDAAGVDKKVTFSWIRDAAYSIALQHTAFDNAELLAGHRLAGTADNYLRRNPQLVAEACAAIWMVFARCQTS